MTARYTRAIVARMDDTPSTPALPETAAPAAPVNPLLPESGGPKGKEPTRFGDWEQNGRCTDF